jgi:hypothetical protein
MKKHVKNDEICKGGLAVLLIFVSRDLNQMTIAHLWGYHPENF